MFVNSAIVVSVVTFCIFDRSPVGMTDCIVQVYYQSAVQSAVQSADCTTDYGLNLYIAVCRTNGRCTKDKIGVVVNRLVVMGL